MRPKKILITGVYGLIGGLVYRRFHELPEKFEVYALDRKREPSERTPDGWKLHIPDERFQTHKNTCTTGKRHVANQGRIVSYINGYSRTPNFIYFAELLTKSSEIVRIGAQVVVRKHAVGFIALFEFCCYLFGVPHLVGHF